MNYYRSKYGRECLKLAALSKSDMKFGAVLVKDGKIIGRGYNRLATKEDRGIIPHVDYAIHSEQLCILDAIKRGEDINNSRVYVLGYGAKNKKLSVREGKYFTCRNCPKALLKFNIPVMIPNVDGWVKLTPEEAMESGKDHLGYWQRHIKS